MRYALFDIRPAGDLALVEGDGWAGVQDDNGDFLLASKTGDMSMQSKLAPVADANQFLPADKLVVFQAELSIEQAQAVIRQGIFNVVVGEGI